MGAADTDEKPVVPACPACGERRWLFEGDITNRAAVEIEPDGPISPLAHPDYVGPRIFIDRCNPDESRFEPGGLVCAACAHEVSDDDPLYEALAAMAKARVADEREDKPGIWRILNDYREF